MAISWLLLATPLNPGPVLYEVLLSTVRFLLPAFPIFLLLGQFGVAHPKGARFALAISLLLLIVVTLRFLDDIFIA